MMRTTFDALTEQELVVHAFAHVEGPLAAEGRAEIGRMWACCRDRLGMTDHVPRLGLPIESGDLTAPGRTVLAAVQRADTNAQAVLRREHDVLSLSALFAPPCARWLELDRMADDLLGTDTDGLVGSARLYLGKVHGDDQRVAASAQLGRVAAGQLPGHGQQDGWWRHGTELPSGFAVWELSTRPDDRVRRRLVVLAPPGRDAQQSAWTWSDGSAAPPPFGRYLMHTAKLRYQMRVHAGLPVATELCSRADEWIARLADPGSTVDRAELRAGQAKIVQLLALLRAMRRTTEIAMDNAAAVGGTTLGGRGPVPDDQEAATAFASRLDDDVAYLAVAEEGLRGLDAIASASPAPHRTPTVFVNYRVKEHPGYAALLHNELTRRFGKGSVFLAAASIRGGDDFVAEVFDRLRECSVVLAVIGRNWLEFSSSDAHSGLGTDQDWVHRELAEAFDTHKRVIPILIEDAVPPPTGNLPARISKLATCQTKQLRHYSLDADLAAIVADVAHAFPHTNPCD